MVDARARYVDALRWLYGFSDWERGVGWNPSAAPDDQWKLGRTRALLDALGAPDRGQRVVLIAGTKGKGSTAMMIESIARHRGWLTGLYTQPHLHSYRERIALNGRPVSYTAFADGVVDLKRAVSTLRRVHPSAGDPTTFELTTALAIHEFARRGVDLTILEVGLGGRLDATNVVNATVAMITPIGLDHTRILGPTIAHIAREKAGIIKPGSRALSARQRPAARREIEARCAAVGVPLRFVPPLSDRAVSTLMMRTDHGDVDERDFRSRAALAPHQRQNAALAIAAVELFGQDGLPQRSGRDGLALRSLRLPARFEIVTGEPVVVVDAAHNQDSASALAQALREARLPSPRWLVLGILRDKDARAVVRILADQVEGVVVTSAPSPRALPIEELARICRAARIADVVEVESVGGAVDRARKLAGSSGTVVVAGSFTVAAAARVALGLATDEL